MNKSTQRQLKNVMAKIGNRKIDKETT